MIDIVIPVLARPANAQKVVDTIRASTTAPHTITFVCSPDDDAEITACAFTEASIGIVDWQPGPGDGAKKWNFGYRFTKHTGHPFVFLGADDLEFTPGWDTTALAEAERTGAGVIGTDDDANPTVKRGRHSTHSLVRRSYIDSVGGTFLDGPGVVYHEGYDHQFVDLELCKAAMDRGEWSFARRSVVRHLHPLFNKSVSMDQTYEKALGKGSQDAAIYRERLQVWQRASRASR